MALTKKDRLHIVASVREHSQARGTRRLDDEQLRRAVTLAMALHETALRNGIRPEICFEVTSFASAAVDLILLADGPVDQRRVSN